MPENDKILDLLVVEVQAARKENQDAHNGLGAEVGGVKKQVGEIVTQVAVLNERVLAHCDDDSRHPKRPCEKITTLQAAVDKHFGRHWILLLSVIVAALAVIGDLIVRLVGE